MEERLEPVELGAVGEDELPDLRAVRRPEPLEQRGADVLVVRDQVVDDLVARDRGRAVSCERTQRLALPGADAAGDRDGD
jgi:hypothetical protein